MHVRPPLGFNRPLLEPELNCNIASYIDSSLFGVPSLHLVNERNFVIHEVVYLTGAQDSPGSF